ncbi:MAG: PKD domain-containing protein [bacterium]
MGDTCENIGSQIGIYISIDKLIGSAPLTTKFSAITKGNVNEIIWDFGDGTEGKGTPITHTFIAPGMYNIQATAKGSTADVKAQVIVIV